MLEKDTINQETLYVHENHEVALTPQEYLNSIQTNIGDIQDKIAKLQATLEALKDNPKYSEIRFELTTRLEALSEQSVLSMREGIDDLIHNLSRIS